jgi:hypothetical protein
VPRKRPFSNLKSHRAPRLLALEDIEESQSAEFLLDVLIQLAEGGDEVGGDGFAGGEELQRAIDELQHLTRGDGRPASVRKTQNRVAQG